MYAHSTAAAAAVPESQRRARATAAATPTSPATTAAPSAPAPNWQRSVYAAAATQLFTLMGFGLAVPFLPLYVQSLGVSDRASQALWAGVLTGAAPLMAAVFSPVWGELADRFGRKLMLARSMAFGAVLIGGMGFVENVWWLLVLRLLQGALTGSQAAALALVAAAAPSRQVAFSLGLVNTAMQIGNMFGPALGGFVVGAAGFRWSFGIAGMLMGVATLIALVLVDEPPRPAPRATPSPSAPRESALRRVLAPLRWPRFRELLLVQMVSQLAFSGSWALVPLYLQDVNRPSWLSAEMALGASVTLAAGFAAVTTIVSGRMMDARGPRLWLLGSLIGAAAFMVPQALFPDVGPFILARAGLGLFVAVNIASLSVLTKEATPPGREGLAYGTSALAQGLGWGFGPILGAGLAAVAGIPLVFAAAAMVLLAVFPAALALTKPRR